MIYRVFFIVVIYIFFEIINEMIFSLKFGEDYYYKFVDRGKKVKKERKNIYRIWSNVFFEW